MIIVSAWARADSQNAPLANARAKSRVETKLELAMAGTLLRHRWHREGLAEARYCPGVLALLVPPGSRVSRERRGSASMTQPNLPGAPNAAANLNLQGGAAIVAPVSAFPGGVPGNALIVLPLNKPTDELTEALKKG